MRWFARTLAIGFVTLSLAVGCSNAPTVLSPQPGVLAPTNAPGTPTNTPTATNTPAPPVGATATPTPAATATPTPAPTPTGSFVPLACNANPNAVPGFYTSIFVSGTATGQTTFSGKGTYSVDSYTNATPTPAPTATPTVGPTAAPTTTPTPRAYFIYSGTYSVPSFSTIGTTSAPSRTTNQTNGCFFLLTTQDGTPFNTGSPDNGFGSGSPSFMTAPNSTNYTTGAIVSGSLTLSAGGGGTFLFDTGTSAVVSNLSRTSATFNQFKALISKRRF